MGVLDERTAVRRLLDRLGFGPRPGELDAAAARGFPATLTALLDPAAPGSDPGVAATPPPNLGPEPPRPAAGDAAAKKQAAQALSGRERTLALWWLDRMVAAMAPTSERLTWFWHGHFATSEQKVRAPSLMLAQNETFRRLGLGDFGALAHALIVDPAMLVWLDAQQNDVRSANENLARESMELFTLGIGHYTEDDVRAAARALTGWTVNRATGAARFVARRHDSTPKTILGTTADFDANSFVDLVLGRPDSPRFVATRLWYRLVSTTPPPGDALDRLVAAYGPGRDVRALLFALASEPAFTDPAQAMVKQPVEWLVGLLRALAMRPSALPAARATRLVSGLRALGQVPFLPPSVGGWPAGPAWLTTSAGLARLTVAQGIAQHASLGAVSTGTANDRVEAVRSLLGVDAWTDRTRAALAQVAGDPRQLVALAACAPEYVVSL